MTEKTQPLLTDALTRLRHLYSNLMNGGVRDTASAKRIAEGLLSPVIADLEKWGTPAPVGVEPLSVDRIAEMMRVTWGGASIAPRDAAPFARAVEAEVHKLYQAPQPMAREPLIRQMRNALALPCDRWNATQSHIVREAIDAADAWLEGN